MNNRLCKVAYMIACCVLLQGCSFKVATPFPPTDPASFRAAIDSWEGAPVEELVISWGEPITIFISSHNETKFYHYMRMIQDPSLKAFCRTTIEVRPDGTIDTSSAFFSEIYYDDTTKKDMFSAEQITYSSSCLWFNPWPVRNISEQSPQLDNKKLPQANNRK